MIRELRAASFSMRHIAESEDDNKAEWAQRVDDALADAADNYELSPLERRRKELHAFNNTAQGGK